MAKTSFAEMEDKGKKSPPKKSTKTKAKAKSVEVDAVEDSSTALIEQPAQVGDLTITNQQLADAGLSGDFDQSDVNLPRINLVAKTSALVDDGFAPGSIALNKELVLVTRDKPLRVIVTHMVKQYQEDVDWGSDELPKTFNSKADVFAAGYSLEWGSPNMCRELAHITMLIEAPAELDESDLELFPYEHNGKNYAMAIYTASKSAYKPTAKSIASYAMFAKGEGVWTTAWNLMSTLRTEGDVSWFTPSLKRTKKLDADELSFVESVR